MDSLLELRPVVLVTGISASGKSTIAEELAGRFERGVHVRGDVYRRMVVSGREEMTAEPSEEAIRQLRLRYRLAAQTADDYHDAGFSVVVQDIILGPLLSEVVDAIRSRPLHVVVLAPRPSVVREREAARAKTAYREGFEGVDALDRALREATPRIGLWLDTSEQVVSETVDEIIRRPAESQVAG